MDITIKKLSREFLEQNINYFIDILYSESNEYWNRKNFLMELPLKYELSIYASINEEIIGYIIASKKGDSAYIHKFMIKESFRNINLGTNLNTFFEKLIIQKDIRIINLSVFKDNENALRFYIRNGYSKDGQKVDSINHIELYIMQKKLI